MSGGSSSGGFQMQPQDNSLQLEAMRESAAAAAQAKIDADKAQARTDFNTHKSDAVTGATKTGNDYFASRGLDPTSYAGLISSIIGDTAMKVPDLDANPGQYFNTDAFASGIDNYNNNQRAGFNTKVNSTFNPGFETSLIPNSSYDPILSSILGTQRNAAEDTINFSRKRGVINDAGYNAAEQALNDQGSAANSTLKSIGDSVLGKDRQDLLNIRGDAGNAASNFSIGGTTPDITGYYGKAQDLATKDLGGLEGSIRSALGSTNLFDPQTALQKGGIAQGPINLTPNAPQDVLPFGQKKNIVGRGLGSTGQF